jgi:hypothetical protein
MPVEGKIGNYMEVLVTGVTGDTGVIVRTARCSHVKQLPAHFFKVAHYFDYNGFKVCHTIHCTPF